MQSNRFRKLFKFGMPVAFLLLCGVSVRDKTHRWPIPRIHRGGKRPRM